MGGECDQFGNKLVGHDDVRALIATGITGTTRTRNVARVRAPATAPDREAGPSPESSDGSLTTLTTRTQRPQESRARKSPDSPGRFMPCIPAGQKSTPPYPPESPISPPREPKTLKRQTSQRPDLILSGVFAQGLQGVVESAALGGLQHNGGQLAVYLAVGVDHCTEVLVLPCLVSSRTQA